MRARPTVMDWYEPANSSRSVAIMARTQWFRPGARQPALHCAVAYLAARPWPQTSARPISAAGDGGDDMPRTHANKLERARQQQSVGHAKRADGVLVALECLQQLKRRHVPHLHASALASSHHAAALMVQSADPLNRCGLWRLSVRAAARRHTHARRARG